MSKLLIFFTLLVLINNTSSAQDDGFYSNNDNYSDKETLKKDIQENTLKIFLGVGHGINNHCGIVGGLLEFAPLKKFSLVGGFGLGSWGIKTALGIRYYNRGFPHKLFYGLTYTSAGGMQDYEIEIETTRSKKELVQMDLNRARNLALSIGYQWRLFKNGRLNCEIGYSVPLQEKAYSVVTPGVELTEGSENIMQFKTPGGLVIGLGFSIGF